MILCAYAHKVMFLRTREMVEYFETVTKSTTFIRLRRRSRIYAGKNAIVIRFGAMSPFASGG